MSLATSVDLLDPATFAHGHPIEHYRWLRENDPIHFNPEKDGPGYWALTRYADIREVGRRPGTFSSTPTIMIQGEALDLGDHQMMLMMDPPRHGKYRRLMIPDFVPRAVATMAERVDELASRIIDAVCERGECDLVDDIAGEMPSFVVAEMLGLPLDDGRELYKLTETIHASSESVPEGAGLAAVMKMFEYATEVYNNRKANPREGDFITSLLAHQHDGQTVDEDYVMGVCNLMLVAGIDTTWSSIGASLWHLAQHPEHQRQLRDNPDLWPTAVEELLRAYAPVTMARIVAHDTEFQGCPMHAGDRVLMAFPAANRDPRQFENPDEVILDRENNRHVAFGAGIHRCAGSNLARLELRVADHSDFPRRLI